MASGTNPKVRFVKCPKCLKVLLEDEDVPVYQCGGCFTILQAKRRNISANGTQSCAETEAARPSESRRESEVEGSSGSSPDMVVAPSPGEFSADARNGSVDTIDKQLTGVRLSDREQTDDIQLRGTSAGDPEQIETENSGLEAEAADANPGSISGSSSVDHVASAARENTLSADGSPRLGAESSPSDNLTASPEEEEEHRQGNSYRDHPHGESADELPCRDYLANNAYDGSASSSDGREERLHDGQVDLFASIDKIAGVSPEQRLRRGKFVMQDHSENEERGASSSALLTEEKHNGIRHNKRGQFRSQQLEGSGERLHRYWRRQETQESQSYLPLYGKGPSFSSAYGHGSPYYHSHDEFDSHSHAYSLQMPPYGERRRTPPVPNWRENHIPVYNHEGFDGMHHDINYGVQHTSATDWGQTSRASRIPFSGESAMYRRHQVGHPRWWSGQLHSSFGSYPGAGSPQQHMEPEYYPGWSREIVSDVEDQQRCSSHDVQTYKRERQRAAKRHLRPTAGGAPFTSCYHCSQTLQMPADFLIFKRKYHYLRCGNCMNVLRFYLEDGIRLVPAVMDPHGSGNSASESSRAEVPKPVKRSSSAKNEELPVARGSPLHRLMGYSTVSQIFKVSRRPPSPRISDHHRTSRN